MKRYVLFALAGVAVYGIYRAFVVWPAYKGGCGGTASDGTPVHGQLWCVATNVISPGAAAAGLVAAWLTR